MTSLETNIVALKTEMQKIEKQLVDNIIPAKQIIELHQNFIKHFNALKLLLEIQATVKARSPIIQDDSAGKLIQV
jgi:hypothetical protein